MFNEEDSVKVWAFLLIGMAGGIYPCTYYKMELELFKVKRIYLGHVFVLKNMRTILFWVTSPLTANYTILELEDHIEITSHCSFYLLMKGSQFNRVSLCITSATWDSNNTKWITMGLFFQTIIKNQTCAKCQVNHNQLLLCFCAENQSS